MADDLAKGRRSVASLITDADVLSAVEKWIGENPQVRLMFYTGRDSLEISERRSDPVLGTSWTVRVGKGDSRFDVSSSLSVNLYA